MIFPRRVWLVPSGKKLSEDLLIFIMLACIFECSSQQHMIKSQIDRLDDVNLREYCIADVFEPTCLKNELIVMTSATYGRMRMGRCLEDERTGILDSDDSRYQIGCQVDVLPLLDRRCSGKNQCAVRVVDLLKEKPCHSALTAYLEADFECITVIEDDRSCTVMVSSNPLHLIRSTTTSCGTKSQPWRLEAPAGQHINISLLNFGAEDQDSTPQNQNNCRLLYGYITEKSGKKNVSICGQSQRKKDIYKSSTNVIEIVMNRTPLSGNKEMAQVILGAIAVGCSDIVPPDDAWLKRNDNDAVVGCYSSRQTWHLRCTGNNWVGVIGNCTRETLELPIVQSVSSSQRRDYQTLILVAIVCFGVGICLIVICIGVICLRRYSSKNLKKMNGQDGVCLTATGI